MRIELISALEYSVYWSIFRAASIFFAMMYSEIDCPISLLNSVDK